MNADDVERAAGLMRDVLGPLDRADWSVPAGTLQWTCRETLAHIAHDLLAYAAQLAGRSADAYLPLDLTVRDSGTVAEVLTIATACGRLLALALRAAGPGERAWHFGPSDAGGFAALGVAEILVHTYDIGQGLRVSWRPPADLSAAVLARLMPDAPVEGHDPADLLLRRTGRLGDAGPWRWTAALK
ncbi:maleylpyruvate isomerase N-terminal domain-containing protein [Actinoplanes sp. KI2]|uniref:maleylpyruvate isomerase N-terminal domain-containing protein n=1 Tax=Actinoplanes sp. KI2 TaxID=2983315 RepID=UPI0021D5A610|nr:maleylpyruvate isomerase N-terminal domain-containing protein [Actinoplanes sp. KI2]MCU7722610.1 maleylpyruvate isomerase N-terminal domain-containing protein [Actinoplanes sp. KI2]